MKRCPSCNRIETDDSLAFCRSDGTPLMRETEEDAGTIRLGDAPAGGAGKTGASVPGASASGGEIHRTHDAQTTLLDPRATSGRTRELMERRSRRGIVAGAAVLLVISVAAAGAYIYRSRGGGSPAINSVAVLPFANASGDKNAEYLSDGVAESLMNSLSQLPDLKVASRNAAFRYKGTDQDAQKVGRDLGVRAVLTGSVKEIGDQIVISVSLDDASDGHHIWGEQYPRKLSDILAVQRDIAQEVTDNLRVKLTSAQRQQLAKHYTDNVEAYQLYLKGRYYAGQFTLEGFRQGVEAYNRAIALDPNYALAYAGLSDAYFNNSTLHLAPREALPKAGEYAREALKRDDTLSEAHMSLANVKANYERDFAGADAEFKRAIELNPNDALSYFEYGWFLSWLGRFDEGIAQLERARRLDPLAGDYVAFVAAADYFARRNEEAMKYLQAAQQMEDKSWFAYYWLGLAYQQRGDGARAIESFQTAAKLDDAPVIRGALARSLALSGRAGEARRLLDDLQKESQTRYVAPYALVCAYVGLGDREQALAWLEKSDEYRDEWLLAMKVDPVLDPLRSDPRFADLMRRVGLPK